MEIIAAIKYKYRVIIAIMSLILLISDCISSYELDIEGRSGLLVVDGSIIKGREKQIIVISKTAPISSPEFRPVENCDVKVMDSYGNEFAFDEESPGRYAANIDDAMLSYNNQYKLVFTTPSGDSYESDYQQLLEAYPVDSVYGITEYKYSPKTEEESVKGIQFYVDLDAPQGASRYYRWVLEETWENYIEDEIWGVYDGQTIKRFYPGDSLQYCWKTKDVTGLYSASTVNLSANRIKKIPLHFLESTSEKLACKYCVTVKQYALNADAHDYWYEKERELKESGNIYSIQPSQPKSNVHNINNPDELVMGFFWAASYTIKRVYIKSPKPSPMKSDCSIVATYCESEDFDQIVNLLYTTLDNFSDLLTEPPLYITVQNRNQYQIHLKPACIDCRIRGGDAKKPDFWE